MSCSAALHVNNNNTWSAVACTLMYQGKNLRLRRAPANSPDQNLRAYRNSPYPQPKVQSAGIG